MKKVRNKWVIVRVTFEEHELIKSVAERKNMTVSDLVRITTMKGVK